MKQLLLCALLLSAMASSGQNVFFQSKQSYTEKQGGSFYSFMNMQGDLLLFNAGDYKLYAYNKTTGVQKWVYYLGRKSDITPFFAGDYIWANTGQSEAVQLDLKGKRVKDLPFSVLTQPALRKNILYTTGIYNAGSMLAYDLASDSVVRDRFLAHGCSRQPYYFADRLIANAEGNHWLEMTYAGKLKTNACESEEHRFPSELSCAEYFAALTHDNKRIDDQLANDLAIDNYNEPDVLMSQQKTFVLAGGQLTILGSRLEKEYTQPLYDLSDGIEQDEYSTAKLLNADAVKVWVLYNKKLIIFDYKKHVLVEMVNLEKWNPHQVLLDGAGFG